MVKVSSFFSWMGGIAQIASAWGICLYFYIGHLQSSYHQNQWWLIVIAIVYTIVGLFILTCRDAAVANGNHVIAWAIVTLLFISILGGIFTIGVDEMNTKYRPRRVVYSNAKQTEEPKQINTPEFIFVKPKLEDDIPEGTTVKIIQGFYVSTIGQRVNSNDLGEVISSNKSEIDVWINHGSSKFRATVSRDNALIKVKNPDFVNVVEEQPAPAAPEKVEKFDKFEEIKKYKELLDLKIITEEEFEKKKKELLG